MSYCIGSQIPVRFTCRNSDESLADSVPPPVVTRLNPTKILTAVRVSLGTYYVIVPTAGLAPGAVKLKIKTVTDLTAIKSHTFMVEA